MEDNRIIYAIVIPKTLFNYMTYVPKVLMSACVSKFLIRLPNSKFISHKN